MFVVIYKGSKAEENRISEMDVPDGSEGIKYGRKFYPIYNAEVKYAVVPSSGRPKGIAREGKYGFGVETMVVRVPKTIGKDIENILATFEQIKIAVDAWELQAEEKITSPRYDQARKLLQELRSYLGETEKM
jgi:hypothetical protein